MDRQTFREYPLDGAALYFHPATGVHVRISDSETRHLTRRAPRVAMFGITNTCNLTCAFCSRDVARASTWTVASAAAALRGLHDAGTLEVAYGGGEPFAFKGFDELVAELQGTTALAQHVTTNGTSIRPHTWRRFAGRFGQVRLSIYDDVGWHGAVETLMDHDQLWGANLLVDRARLEGLPSMLAELAARGCHDVSLLSYVGAEARRHLDADGNRRLAAIVADSPLLCRLSVCFGDRVPVPLLYGGDTPGDCGAGRDFVSITPDRRVQSCSFQERSLPGATADEILAAWRLQQTVLAQASPRRGCARSTHRTADPAPLPPISIWRSFSGNNSGECLLVATFQTIDDAESYLGQLIPSWTPNGDYPPAWRTLFADEGVLASDVDTRYDEGPSPREMVAIGRSVIAVQYAAEDAFPELRALACKRDAFVVPGGIHVHDGIQLLLALEVRDAADRDALLASSPYDANRTHVHGDVLLVVTPVCDDRHWLAPLNELQSEIVRFVGDRPFAVELFFDAISEGQLMSAKQRLGHRPAQHSRLSVWYWGDDRNEKASRFAHSSPGRATVAGGCVLIDPVPDRKRLSVLAYRDGGRVRALDGARIELAAMLWYDAPTPQRGTPAEVPRFDDAQVKRTLQAVLPQGAGLTLTRPSHKTKSWNGGPTFTVTTDQPGGALRALGAYAESIGAQLSASAQDLDPLGCALRRLFDAL